MGYNKRRKVMAKAYSLELEKKTMAHAREAKRKMNLPSALFVGPQLH
jgi:hypothetical protein